MVEEIMGGGNSGFFLAQLCYKYLCVYFVIKNGGRADLFLIKMPLSD